MSLYLISNDPKLRSYINRQLKSGCISATNMVQLKKLKQQVCLDGNPVVMIDDEFSQKGSSPISRTVMLEQIPGIKIILTNNPLIELEEGYVLDGTFGLLRRNCSIEQLIACVIDAGGLSTIKAHLTDIQLQRNLERISCDPLASHLVGQSEAIVTIRNIIRRIAPVFSCVHINGETGTGKEVVAQLLRTESRRADPFVVVNCSTIPETLADTHLFGSERGAYTDAKESTPGYIARADGGLLFLDELEDMHRSVQGKLLRILETKRYQKVGGTASLSSRFRLITASNISLDQLYERGHLRADLYFRLNRLVISIPPLRERKEDIPLLINHFLRKLGESRRPDAMTLSKMMDHSWPGNARELFHELERLSVFADREAQELSYTEILTGSSLNLA